MENTNLEIKNHQSNFDNNIEKQYERVPLILRVRRVIMLIALISMFSIGITAFYMMLRMRNSSEGYIIENVEMSVMHSLQDVADYVSDALDGFEIQMDECADFLTDIYTNKDVYKPRDDEKDDEDEENEEDAKDEIRKRLLLLNFRKEYIYSPGKNYNKNSIKELRNGIIIIGRNNYLFELKLEDL